MVDALLTTLLWCGIAGGIASAAAAVWGRYFELPDFSTGPVTCKLEAGGCQVLFRTPRAAILGIPKAVLALVFYLLLILGLYGSWPIKILLLGASGALGMSVFLGYSLLSRKLQCRICWTGHFANAAIWGVLLLRWLSSSSSVS